MADDTLNKAPRPAEVSAVAEPRPSQSTTLDAWAKHEWTNGIQLETLAPLHTMDVRTRNTTYRVVVIDGRRGDVLITGGRFFPTPTRARLNGCSLGGSCLKWRGLYCGFRVELQLDGETIITTRVKSISVLNDTPLAGESVH
jgi:hypothetical protein